MGLLTYDRGLPREPRTVADFLDMGAGVPDRIEIAESGETWTYVIRSRNQIEIVAKVTGRVISQSPACEETYALLAPHVASAARQAMSLADRERVL